MNPCERFLVLLTGVLVACSSDPVVPLIAEDDAPVLSSISPPAAKLGDTVAISGERLDHLLRVEFNGVSNPVIHHQTGTILVRVPALSHEKVVVKGVYQSGTNLLRTNPLDFRLNGVFELDTEVSRGGLGWGVQVQIVSDSLYFAAFQATGGGFRIVRSENGGQSWEHVTGLVDFNRMHFFDKTNGIITIGNEVFITNDGRTFGLIGAPTPDNDGQEREDLIDIALHEDTGFLLSEKGEIYRTMDFEHYELLYDFPLADHNDPAPEFIEMQVMDNEHLWAIGNSATLGPKLPIVISMINGAFSFHTIGKGPVTRLHFFDPENGLAHSDGSYRSWDGGKSWQLARDIAVRNFIFENDSVGLGVFLPADNTDEIRITVNKGLDWKPYFKTNNFAFITAMDENNGIGLFTSNDGRMWKYVSEYQE